MRVRRALTAVAAAAALTAGVAACGDDAGDPVPTPEGGQSGEDTTGGGDLEGGEPGSVEGDQDVEADPAPGVPTPNP